MSKQLTHYNLIGLRRNAPPAQVHEAHDHWLNTLKPLLVAETSRELNAQQRWERHQKIEQIDGAYQTLLNARNRRRRARSH